VCIVDNQQRIVRFGQLDQRRQGCDVAVHAEDGVGCDQLASRLRRGEPRFERRHVRMRVADEFRSRKQRAIVQARVVQTVAEDRVVAPGERGQDREIREIAGRERESKRAGAGPNECRELRLERCMRGEMTGDEMRRAGADTPACGTVARRGDNVGMARQSEVVVARERNALAAVHDNPGSLCCLERAPRALAALGLAAGEIGGEPCGQRVRHTRYISACSCLAAQSASLRISSRYAGGDSRAERPSRANSARSAATSGFAVVRSLSP
jgi:hypothetical protein